MATLRKHKEQVWLCKFNDKGDKFATVCQDGQILIWALTPQGSGGSKSLNSEDMMQHNLS